MENINQSSTSQQEFSGYVKNPERVDISDEKMISSLIEKFPYAQILHAFEAKCHNNGTESDTFLEKAALYISDRSVLYNIIHKPEYFRIRPLDNNGSVQGNGAEDHAETSVDKNPDESRLSSYQDESSFVPLAGGTVIDEAIESTKNAVTDSSGQEMFPISEEIEPEEDEQPEITAITETESSSTSIDDEQQVPDVPVEVTDDLYEDVRPAILTENVQEPEEESVVIVERTDDKNSAEKPGDETEKLIISNIAASDFFRFEEKIDDQLTPHTDKEPADESIGKNKHSFAQGVSKYDDDKMPYTFLWWLNKTRKEYSATYQPYTNFKLDTTKDIKKDSVPILNQQIIENIFHLQSPLEDIKEEEKPKTVEFTVKRKDDHIIDRFIREEPQIRPPKPEKLDTENKAKRSSEDSYDMVSETLANVYIEQMLFHKAIDTYKKLSLKFPEKSAYFADQIRKLETTN